MTSDEMTSFKMISQGLRDCGIREMEQKEEKNNHLRHPRNQYQHRSLSRFVTRTTFLRLQLSEGDLPAVEQRRVRLFVRKIKTLTAQ
jgi:hypothetical protein